jgi:N-acetylneuraminate synthase
MMEIGGVPVGLDAPPFIIAEVSGNHGGSLGRALEIIEAVAAAGAQAVKLQTYTADSMTFDIDHPRFRISDPASLWTGRHLHELYREAATPWEWHEPIFRRARELGLVVFSSPFDADAVELLDGLDAACMKIASFEIVDLPLIRAAARTGRPMIISTGMATRQEIEEAVSAARTEGCEQLAVLQCTSSYPAPAEASNLRTIPDLRAWTGAEVGLSDHTLGIGVAVAAVALGATLIEKHVTISRSDGAVDSTFSLEPHELGALVLETRRAWESLGSVEYGPTDADRSSLAHRRSLFFDRDLAAGAILTDEDFRSVRPSDGLAPRHADQLVGRRLTRAVRRGEPIQWDDLTD